MAGRWQSEGVGGATGGGSGLAPYYQGAVAAAASLVSYTDATIGSTANVGASAAAYVMYELKGTDPTVLADWQPLQGTLSNAATGTVYTIEIIESKPERTLLVVVPVGNIVSVTVNGASRPPLFGSTFAHQVGIADVPGSTSPTSVTVQTTTGTSTAGTFSLIDGSPGNVTIFGDAATYAAVTAAYPAAGANLLALPAGSRVYVEEFGGEIRRNAAGTAWISTAVLGPYTRSGLQTAYANGGADLAAMPSGISAWVTDVGLDGCRMTPNTAKTRWTNTAPVVLFQGAIATHNGPTSYTTQNTLSIKGRTLFGHALEVDMYVTFSGTANTKNIRIQYGGSSIGDKLTIGATNVYSNHLRTIFGSATSAQIADRSNVSARGNDQTTGVVYTAAVDSESDQNLTLDFQTIDGGDSMTATMYRVRLI